METEHVKYRKGTKQEEEELRQKQRPKVNQWRRRLKSGGGVWGRALWEPGLMGSSGPRSSPWRQVWQEFRGLVFQ